MTSRSPELACFAALTPAGRLELSELRGREAEARRLLSLLQVAYSRIADELVDANASHAIEAASERASHANTRAKLVQIERALAAHLRTPLS